MYYVIISRHCARMQEELAGAVRGRKDIQLILDRRYGERRTDPHPTSPERRRKDRRCNPKMPLADSGN
jgi:hypothetical protein